MFVVFEARVAVQECVNNNQALETQTFNVQFMNRKDFYSQEKINFKNVIESINDFLAQTSDFEVVGDLLVQEYCKKFNAEDVDIIL